MSDLRADELGGSGGGGTHANRQPMHPCGPPAVKNESAPRQKRKSTSIDAPICRHTYKSLTCDATSVSKSASLKLTQDDQ